MELVETAGSVSLCVADDGAGFDQAQVSEGFGLMGMHERAGLVGGTVSVDSAPGEGTTVRAEVPARRGDGEELGASALASPSRREGDLAG